MGGVGRGMIGGEGVLAKNKADRADQNFPVDSHRNSYRAGSPRDRGRGELRRSQTDGVQRGGRRAGVVEFFQAEDGIRDYKVTGVQTCALPIWAHHATILSSIHARRTFSARVAR